MLLRDETKNFILGVLASLLANALYEACRYAYRRRVITSIHVKVTEKWHRIIEQAQLLYSLIIRGATYIKVRVQTGSHAARGLVSLKTKVYLKLLECWWLSVNSSYLKRKNNIRIIRVSLQNYLAMLRLSSYPPLVRALIVVALAIAITLSMVVIREDREATHLQLPSREIANKTKDQLRSLIENHNDVDELIVSYWFIHNGTLYQFSTTDEKATYISFPADQSSIIGCAFANPNHFVRRDDESAQVIVSSFNGEPTSANDRCEFLVTGGRRIKSIVCDSYNPSLNPEYTVGICVSTEGKQNIISNDSLDIVKRHTEDFYQAISPLLKDKKTVITNQFRIGRA